MNQDQDADGCTRLYRAAQSGHLNQVDYLIKVGADVNKQTLTGRFPLWIASQNGHLPIAQHLIDAGANVNLQTEDGTTALYIASQIGHRQLVKELINANANVDLKEHDDCSPLFIASQNGHQCIVESLANARVAIDAQMNSGESPLYIACLLDRLLVVRVLINAGANIDLQKHTGQSPLYTACRAGHKAVVKMLIQAQANVNLAGPNGKTPLFVASQNGHCGIVRLLIQAEADVTTETHTGQSPLYIASQNGLCKIVQLLIKELLLRGDGQDQIKAALHRALLLKRTCAAQLLRSALESRLEHCACRQRSRGEPFCPKTTSLWLSEQLRRAGFTRERAALQGIVAEVLQEILQRRRPKDNYFIVGSFIEAWANNLKTLDGRTGLESDIDVISVLPKSMFHPKGLCQCKTESVDLVEYNRGYIWCSGYAAEPAIPYLGCALKPAVDEVYVRRICAKPAIPERLSSSRLPLAMLQELRQDLESASTPGHVVHAALPGKAGECLRVSTAFQEMRLLRCMDTVQGHLLVILKSLLWNAVRPNKFKTYFSKTIMLRMLEETPAEQWNPENLCDLTDRAVNMLLDSVKTNMQKTGKEFDGRVMDHFFLEGDGIYLKYAEAEPDKQMIALEEAAGALQRIISNLPRLLRKFGDSLRPIPSNGQFYLHPFLTLPFTDRAASRGERQTDTRKCEYHEIYDIVRDGLLLMTKAADSSTEHWKKSMECVIKGLPYSAHTARECFRAMLLLKRDQREAAAKIVRRCGPFRVSRNAAELVNKPTKDAVWHYLRRNDSAWRFCFDLDERPELCIENPRMRSCLPLQMANYSTYYYMNFNALLLALRYELQVIELQQTWTLSVIEQPDTDEPELVVAAATCEDDEVLHRLRHRFVDDLGDVPLWLDQECEKASPGC